MKSRIFLFIALLFFATSLLAKLTLSYSITGIDDPLLKNANERLAVLEKNIKKPWTVESINEFYRQGKINIVKAVEPYGYFHPIIISSLTKSGDIYSAIYQVSKGKPVIIRKININILGPGQNVKVFSRLKKELPIKIGDVFNVEKYNDSKSALFATAQQLGFMRARMSEQKVIINKNNNSAQIILHFNTGPRYKFGKVHFSKNPMNQHFLQSYVHFKQGDYFDPNKLIQLQQALSGTPYFKQVAVKANMKKTKNQQVPVDVNLKMNKKQKYSIGVGYGTDTKLRGLLSWHWRRITPTGQHFKATIRASQIQSGLLATYYIPGANPLTTQYTISGSIEEETPRVRVSDLQTFSAPQEIKSRSQSLSFAQVKKKGFWQRTIALTFQNEKADLITNEDQSTHVLMPSISWVRTKTNDPLNPTKASKIRFSIKAAAKNAGSSVSFLQLESFGKWIRSINKFGKVIFRVNLGYTLINDVNNLPVKQQFYVGGPQTIRGFDYKSIGPGKYLYVGSIEYQHRIYKNWSGAVFFDAGNAISSFSEEFLKQLRQVNLLFMQSVGIGVIYNSPVGPITVTFAKPINGPERRIRFQFSLGPGI